MASFVNIYLSSPAAVSQPKIHANALAAGPPLGDAYSELPQTLSCIWGGVREGGGQSGKGERREKREGRGGAVGEGEREERDGREGKGRNLGIGSEPDQVREKVDAPKCTPFRF